MNETDKLEEDALEVRLGQALLARGWKLASAESCTGGLIGHRLTNVPGSSAYYLGGVTAYDNSVKERLLGVQRETLARHGAVSEETAMEMARGVRLALGADMGISVTGIAGPGGGSVEKPTGLTWISLSTASGEQAWRYVWEGSRPDVKRQAAAQALRLALDHLADETLGEPSAQALNRQSAPRPFEAVEVSAHFDRNGHLRPQSVQWNGQTYPVESTGRRWQAGDGWHILAMLPGQTVELRYDPAEASWALRPGSVSHRAA